MSRKSSQRSSTISDLYDVRSLLNKYVDDIQTGELKVSDTALYEAAKIIDFDFCHYVSDESTKMTSSLDLFSQDSTFPKALENCSVKESPRNAPFLNGCVKISKKHFNC